MGGTTENLPNVSVRFCEPRDLEAIAAIYAHEVTHGTATFEVQPPTTAEMRRRMESVTSVGCPYVVAERAGQIVGYAYAGLYRPRPAYRHTVEDSIYIDKDARGRGIGRLLLREVIDQTSRHGFRQMIAVIGDSKNQGSIRLHESAGFTMIGVLRSVGWKHEQWLDTVLMQRALGAGSTQPGVSP